MILYFSGTGNSAYVAKQIAAQTGDKVVNLLEKFQKCDYSAVESQRPWVIVAPVYAWQLPQIVADWILKTEFVGSREMYFVITCGGQIGNAGHYAKQLCLQKNLHYKGSAAILMPENYVPMFEAPGVAESIRIIDAAEPSIQAVSDAILESSDLPAPRITFMDKFLSGPVNQGFNAVTNSAKKFHADDSCTGCGQCVKLCPTNNVKLEGGKPSWNNTCINCMACICLCPVNAIAYGRKGKKRYECPKNYK